MLLAFSYNKNQLVFANLKKVNKNFKTKKLKLKT